MAIDAINSSQKGTATSIITFNLVFSLNELAGV
jgi:hypothetical protein